MCQFGIAGCPRHKGKLHLRASSFLGPPLDAMRKSEDKTLPCSASENEMISDGYGGRKTKPCPFPWTFFSLQSKSLKPLEEETTDPLVHRDQAEIH